MHGVHVERKVRERNQVEGKKRDMGLKYWLQRRWEEPSLPSQGE